MLTAEEVRKLLSYDPATGILTWRVSPRKKATRVKAGDVAGCIFVSGKNKKEYRKVRVNGTKYFSHRLIWLIVTGMWPKHEVDHQDGNGTNNKWDNLSIATHAENMRNTKKRSDNTSGCTGIHRNKQANRWAVYISVNGKKNSPRLLHQHRRRDRRPQISRDQIRLP